MEWIFNPDLTEEDIKQIYKDPEKNPDEYWGYCRTTRLAYRHDNIRSLFDYYNGDSSYIDWLKEQKIIIPKETECEECKRLEAWYAGIDDGMDVQRPICDECAKDLPPLNATSATEAAKSYSHLDKLNNDPGYLRLKIKELEGDIAKIEYRNEQHRDKITKLVDEKEELENRLDECKKKCSKWYTNYKELDTKIGALQDVLNGIRIIIGG